MPKFKNALVSVSDKSGLVEFLKPLVADGLRVVSTGGTLKHLRENGIPAIEISEQTGFPEVMDGRVKTLHPRDHMALLSRDGVEEDASLLRKEGLEPFDLLVVTRASGPGRGLAGPPTPRGGQGRAIPAPLSVPQETDPSDSPPLLEFAMASPRGCGLLRATALAALLATGMAGCHEGPLTAPDPIDPVRAQAKPAAAPVVTATDPPYGHQGDLGLVVGISGSGFGSDAVASWERNGAPDSKVNVRSTR